jgi:hypothetical protein
MVGWVEERNQTIIIIKSLLGFAMAQPNLRYCL